jgi:hypothetical protein
MAIWLRTNKKKILVHSLILGGFLLYSLFLAEPLFERFEVIPGEAKLVQLQLPGETNDVHYALDRIIATMPALEIHGWAFTSGHDTGNNNTYLVLKSDENTYVFETSAVYSSQVTMLFQESGLDLDWTGFTAIIPARKIEPGEYDIGLCIAGDGGSALQYTEEAIVKSKDEIYVRKEND